MVTVDGGDYRQLSGSGILMGLIYKPTRPEFAENGMASAALALSCGWKSSLGLDATYGAE
jgi:hypothetical protein